MNTLLCLFFFASPAFKCDVIVTPPSGKCELHGTCTRRSYPDKDRVVITPPPGKYELHRGRRR